MSIKPSGSAPRTLPSRAEVAPQAVEPKQVAAPRVGADRFDAALPKADVLAAPLMNDGQLAGLEKSLSDQAGLAAEVFPAELRGGIKEALTTSISRVRAAKAAGRIEPAEAGAALEMMRELFEGLADLRAGRAKVTVKYEGSDGVRVWNLRSPDGDEFAVTARRSLDERGEARIGFRQALDDGRALPGRHRVGLRVDLERFGSASVDMQFGGSSLDKRIHGLMKNPDGSVFETESGKKLADHHFRDDLPEVVKDPVVFAGLVDAFAQGTMAPFEVLP